MLLNHIILAILWIVFCILHSVMANSSFKKRLQNHMGKSYKYYRIFYTLFSFLFLVALLYFQGWMSSIILYRITNLILATGLILSFGGLTLMVFCIRKYFISLSGLRSLFYEKSSETLMINGIHRYIRHPLYLGTFLFIWGLFLIQPYISLLIANTIITAYTLIGIRFEEDKLVEEFGDRYMQYKKKVPKLFPFIKTKRKI